MILGDFQFSIKGLSPNSLTRTTEYNWSDAERIGDLPNLQNLGILKDQIEIEGVFYPKINATTQYNSIEKLAKGTAQNQIQSFVSNELGVSNIYFRKSCVSNQNSDNLAFFFDKNMKLFESVLNALRYFVFLIPRVS